MERTLFAFIWKYSRRQQLLLLVLSVLSFPFLYISLELPKRIINDAIGSPTERVDLLGYDLTQIQFLMTLCFAFLATVLASGLMKMRINTMKGVLAERMLRRLRYMLIARMMRFPKPYFRTTSQGELVSMITSEAEPMGGLMGDAIAQPVFQFGQMMTIVIFLFAQSVWFGLASVALIPLQAWLIPKLQRQINLLNKSRISEIRKLSSEIGESAAGISDLRANGGWRYRMAMFSDRLGRLFEIRHTIYRKKYFMKFINNLITHMTPFLYYSFGGILAIRGDISIGALVAALGAYKDLSSPWKALLLYYNQVQDMSLRWEIVTERFAPRGMIKEELFEGEPDVIPRLDGPIEFRNVSVEDQDGNIILENINLTIPPGARVAIQSSRTSERAAFGQLLTREILPSHGEVILSGHPLEEMHQTVIAARIGYAHSRPYLFDGTLGDNLLMPLMPKPQTSADEATAGDKARALEAEKSGNSQDSPDADWLDPGLAGLERSDEIRAWWFELVEAMGLDEFMVRRTLKTRFDPKRHPKLSREVVRLRPEILKRLKSKGLDEAIHRFDPDIFNPGIPLGGNLLYAAPSHDIPQEDMASEHRFVRLLYKHGLADEAIEISQAVIETLTQTFGKDGTDHPLFRRLGLEKETYLRLSEIARKRQKLGEAALSADEEALMLIVPLTLTAEQIGPGFPEHFKQEILAIRKSHAAELRRSVGDRFTAIDPDVYIERLTVIENAIFGRVSLMAGARAGEIEELVAEVFAEQGLRRRIAAIIYDLPTGLGGANLPTVFQERAAFSRAGIKRPDILVLDKTLSSHDSKSRVRTRQKLRKLLPGSIMIFLESTFDYPDEYDLFVEIRDGRLDGLKRVDTGAAKEAGTADLSRKLAIIADTRLFAGLDAKNQRLLAFSAQWFEAEPGQVIFSHGQTADAAYLCLKGRAELLWPTAPERAPLSVIGPGRLIGDLAVITNEPRAFDLIAREPSTFLRIGAEDFRSVIENDATVAIALLRTVAGHLNGAAELLRVAQLSADQGTSQPPPVDGE